MESYWSRLRQALESEADAAQDGVFAQDSKPVPAPPQAPAPGGPGVDPDRYKKFLQGAGWGKR